MSQQNQRIRREGELHHYQLDSGLHWLQIRFPDDPEIANLRAKIGVLPSIGDTQTHAQQAKKILFQYSKKLNSLEYANIYSIIEHAIQLTK